MCEVARVLRPGGRMVALETSPAPENVIKPFSTAYIKYVVPMVVKEAALNGVAAAAGV